VARNLLGVLVQTGKAIERDRKRRERESARDYATAVRNLEKAMKAEEKAVLMMKKAGLAELKSMEKARALAYTEKMKAIADEQNSELTAIYEDIDGLLEHTLGIDDFVDLESLRRKNDFDPKELGMPLPTPKLDPLPPEPIFEAPPKPKGIFGRKKKLALATAEAQEAFDNAHSTWQSEVNKIQLSYEKRQREHAALERDRIQRLGEAQLAFEREVSEHNEYLDQFINNLGYGTVEAIEEYVSIVVSNSVYPEHFLVNHTFNYEPSTAELRMRVVIPEPSRITNIKTYKYQKSSDEIVSTTLSNKAQKDRYNGAVHQVAIRTFHEIFEADRRGLIKSISLEVGTEAPLPSTGNIDFIPFVAAAAEREAFMEYDLSSIVVIETLKHLGAAISKNPFELIGVDSNGVRRS